MLFVCIPGLLSVSAASNQLLYLRELVKQRDRTRDPDALKYLFSSRVLEYASGVGRQPHETGGLGHPRIEGYGKRWQSRYTFAKIKFVEEEGQTLPWSARFLPRDPPPARSDLYRSFERFVPPCDAERVLDLSEDLYPSFHAGSSYFGEDQGFVSGKAGKGWYSWCFWDYHAESMCPRFSDLRTALKWRQRVQFSSRSQSEEGLRSHVSFEDFREARSSVFRRRKIG